jgi:hypothetical protein
MGDMDMDINEYSALHYSIYVQVFIMMFFLTGFDRSLFLDKTYHKFESRLSLFVDILGLRIR